MSTEIEKIILEDEQKNAVRYVEVTHHYDDEEEEIDLVELAKYVWSKKTVWIATTVVGLAVAAAYCFVVVKPSYGYSALLRIPAYNTTQINTCVETLKNDVGKVNDGTGNAFSSVSLLKGTAVLKLDFSGNDPAKVKAVADKYLLQAQKEATKIANESEEFRRNREAIAIIKKELQTPRYQEQSTLAVVQQLNANVEKIEQQVLKSQAELLPAPAKASPVVPNRKKFLGIGLAAGLFLGLGYAVVKFLLQGSKK